jgi:hypothetical protein
VDFAASNRNPFGVRLVADIHHFGAAPFVEMSQFVGHALIISKI